MNAKKSLGLVRAGGHPQRLHGEAGVAHPGVAVVPVALAADALGQRRGRRRRRSRRWAGRSAPAAPGRCGAPGRATGPRSSGAASDHDRQAATVSSSRSAISSCVQTRAGCSSSVERCSAKPHGLARRAARAGRSRVDPSQPQRHRAWTAPATRRRRAPCTPPSTARQQRARPARTRAAGRSSTLDLDRRPRRRSPADQQVRRAAAERVAARCPAPIASASVSTTVPVGGAERRLQHQRAVEVAPGDSVSRRPGGSTSARPSSSSSRPKTDGLSKRGKHSQSTEPSGGDQRGASGSRTAGRGRRSGRCS